MLNTEIAQVQFDRNGDHLRRYFDKKWESMDLTWYQQHRNLAPKERKGNASQKYSEIFQKYLKQWDKMSAEQIQLANQQQLAPNEKPRPSIVHPANSFLPYPKNTFGLITQAYNKKNDEIQREILQLNAAYQQQQNSNNLVGSNGAPGLAAPLLPSGPGGAYPNAANNDQSIGPQPQ